MKRLAALFLLAALQLEAAPRPVSEAEREALALAASYLARGPEVLLARLTPDAPLRALPPGDALAELTVRTGPREGATWTLRTTDSATDAAFTVTWPSGFSDGLLLRMKQTGRGWLLHEVLTLGEQVAPARDTAVTAKRRIPVEQISVAIVLLLVGFGIRNPHRITGLVLIAAGAAFGAAVTLHHFRAPDARPATFVELRPLVSMRNALARGSEATIPEGVAPLVRNIGLLWLLQSGAAAKVDLAAIGASPLGELVRARLALNAGKEEEAARAFRRAASVRPIRDDVLHEAALSLPAGRASPYLAQMLTLGSRDAEAYYREGSYESFRTAWHLEPKPREELVRDDLLTDLRARSLVAFYSALEPVRKSALLGTSPVGWPAGAAAFVTGETLRLHIGNATLEIPNGAALAPADAQIVGARFGESERDAAALRDAEELLGKRGNAPQTRRARAVAALARHNRWPDVLTLTEGSIPPELLVLRLRALLRARRIDEARALAESDDVLRLDDPNAVVAIADALSGAGQWPTAEKLFLSVKSDAYAEVIAIRLRQLQLRRALASNSQVIRTANFDIRHDASINPALGSRIGELLEAELARLLTKFPPLQFRRVAVNVLRWEDFSKDITMSDHILGLYDGEILFPFAAVAQFKPEVVAVITHELTHAIIAQATADNAPRWFQEGVATRMELVERQENAFSDTPPALVLPVTLLDAVMEKNSDPAAYAVAQTFIRFLEAGHGTDVVARLTAELARGSSTDEAVRKLTGKSLDALNADFRQWGFNNNGGFRQTEPWPYAHFYSLGVDPRVRAGFTF